jgi:hypothetical protein
MTLLGSVSAHAEDLFPDAHQRRDPQPASPGVRFEAVRFARRSVLVRLLGSGEDRAGQQVLTYLGRRLLLEHLLERFEVAPASWDSPDGLLVTGPAAQVSLRTLVPAGLHRFFPAPLRCARTTIGRRVVLSSLGEYGSGPSDWAALCALRRKLADALRVDPRKPGAPDLAALLKTPVPSLGLHRELANLTTGFFAL